MWGFYAQNVLSNDILCVDDYDQIELTIDFSLMPDFGVKMKDSIMSSYNTMMAYFLPSCYIKNALLVPEQRTVLALSLLMDHLIVENQPYLKSLYALDESLLLEINKVSDSDYYNFISRIIKRSNSETIKKIFDAIIESYEKDIEVLSLLDAKLASLLSAIKNS